MTVEQQAIIVAFRKYTLLPLDDCLDALEATIRRFTRSSLHRCMERQGVSPAARGQGRYAREKEVRDPIGFFHIDLTRGENRRGQALVS